MKELPDNKQLIRRQPTFAVSWYCNRLTPQARDVVAIHQHNCSDRKIEQIGVCRIFTVGAPVLLAAEVAQVQGVILHFPINLTKCILYTQVSLKLSLTCLIPASWSARCSHISPARLTLISQYKASGAPSLIVSQYTKRNF